MLLCEAARGWSHARQSSWAQFSELSGTKAAGDAEGWTSGGRQITGICRFRVAGDGRLVGFKD